MFLDFKAASGKFFQTVAVKNNWKNFFTDIVNFRFIFTDLQRRNFYCKQIIFLFQYQQFIDTIFKL